MTMINRQHKLILSYQTSKHLIMFMIDLQQMRLRASKFEYVVNTLL